MSSYTFVCGHAVMSVVMEAFVMMLHSFTLAIFTPLFADS